MTSHTSTTQSIAQADTLSSPSLARKKALVLFGVSVLAMIPGWLLGAFMPLWIAPIVENLGVTLLIYLLLPCVLWIMAPLLIVRYWRQPRESNQRIYWVERYTLLTVIWVIGFLLTFNQAYDENVYSNILFNQGQGTCTQVVDDVVIHYCEGGFSYGSEWDWLFMSTGTYTFEGREGLPFVWYTGEVEENTYLRE